MKKLVTMLAALALAGCGGEAPPAVVVQNVVVTAPAVPGGMGAAYFTITTNRENSRLAAITSPSVQTIELHQTSAEGVRSRMRPLTPEETRFSPSEPLRFAPGGKHAMLMGVDPSVQPGARISLTFQIEPVGTVTAEAEVRGPGQAHAEH